mgnify:CR=1 FL=1
MYALREFALSSKILHIAEKRPHISEVASYILFMKRNVAYYASLFT